MNNIEFLERLKEEKLVVVVRGKNTEQALEIAEACISGGVKLIEITFTVPGAADLIKVLSEKYENSSVSIGAGTVLEISVAEQAIKNGATFIVSPDLNPHLAEYCKANNIAYCPGVLTPTEVSAAIRSKCLALKLFPGDIIKPQGLKALKGPFPLAQFMVTGGVALDNLKEWFEAGAVAVGAGSNLTAKAKTGDFDGVVKEARAWVEKIKDLSK